MAIRIGRYQAEGPFTTTDFLLERSGVYTILTKGDIGSSWSVVDIGECHNVKMRIANHDRSACWSRFNRGTLACAVIYTPGKQKLGRIQIEQELRAQYSPSCGDR
jgi:hypothetical protein